MKLSDLPKSLTDDEINSLFNKYRETGDITLRDRLIEGLLRRVFLCSFGNNPEASDSMFAEACYCLMKAIEYYMRKGTNNFVYGVFHIVKRGKVDYQRFSSRMTQPSDMDNDNSLSDHHIFSMDLLLDSIKERLRLTDQQVAMLKLRGEGYTQREIGSILCMTKSLVDKQLQSLKTRLEEIKDDYLLY